MKDGTFTRLEEQAEEARAIVAIINGREALGEVLPDFVEASRVALQQLLLRYEKEAEGKQDATHGPFPSHDDA